MLSPFNDDKPKRAKICRHKALRVWLSVAYPGLYIYAVAGFHLNRSLSFFAVISPSGNADENLPSAGCGTVNMTVVAAAAISFCVTP